MNFKLTLYLTVVLAVALGIVLFVVKPRNSTSITKARIEARRVFKMDGSSIEKVSVENEHGSFTVQQSSPGNWTIVSPVHTGTDRTVINGIVNGIKTLDYERNIGAGPLSAFGLSPASITATVTSSDNRVYTVEIGTKTPVGEYYYARAVHGRGGIFTITGWIRNELDSTLFHLRDKSVLSIPRNDIEGISFSKKGRPAYALKQSNGVWFFARPSYNRLKTAFLNDMLFKLTNLTATNIIDDASGLRGTGLEKPSAIIGILGSDNRKFDLKIGKEADRNDVYAAVSGRPPVYVINKGILSTFDKPVGTMVDDKLLMQSKWSLSSVEIVWHGRAVTLSRKDYTHWLKDGSPYAGTKDVSGLIDTLTSAGAERFVEKERQAENAAIT
ncbi:MAG: DUF4340 domain-containing protein, partial [Deltaproteobacteria bacterium]|nr:DUF4340 domain-containing protein [Deltaproteobacteria bacterium]